MKKKDLFSRATFVCFAICFCGFLSASGSGAVAQTTQSFPYVVNAYDNSIGDDFVASDSNVAFTEESVEEHDSSNDPLADFQRQLETLRQETESLRKELDAEKKKNEKKPNGPFSVKVGAQVRFDGVYISENETAKNNFGDVVNATGINDIRVSLSGSGYGNLSYNLGVQLSNGLSFLDAYIRAKDTAFGDVTLGNQFVESGMESTETNSERAFPSLDEGASFFSLRRRLGVSTRLFGAEKRTRAFLGAFLPQNIASSPNRIYLDNVGITLNARLSTVPVYIEDSDGFTREALHLGSSFYWLDPASNQTLSLRTAGQCWYSGNSKFLQGIIPLNGKSYSVTNIDTAYQYEGWAISAEGYLLSVRDLGDAYGVTIASRWLLTPGCTRTYKRDDGRFGGVKMSEDALFLDVENRVVGRNMGAWEALAKWEWLEANDLKMLPDSTYGAVNRVALAVNWFWNEQVLWTFGWEHAFVNSQKSSGGEAKGQFDTLLLQGYFRL